VKNKIFTEAENHPEKREDKAAVFIYDAKIRSSLQWPKPLTDWSSKFPTKSLKHGCQMKINKQK
jgi:hypothetical protein